MAKANKNFILKKVRSITIEDRATNEQKVSLVQLKNIGLSTNQEFTDATGKDNVTLARFETAKKATITASSYANQFLGTHAAGFHHGKLAARCQLAECDQTAD